MKRYADESQRVVSLLCSEATLVSHLLSFFMIPWLSLLSVLLSFFLTGCFPTTMANSSIPTLGGQTLPISAIATTQGSTQIQLEVARTAAQQELGLMYRPALPDNRGMLFVFSAPQPVSFWMKNVPVPLDMVFLNGGVVKYIQASAPPCPSLPCDDYGPSTPIDQVIELRSGRAQELGLQVGQKIKIQFLDTHNSHG